MIKKFKVFLQEKSKTYNIIPANAKEIANQTFLPKESRKILLKIQKIFKKVYGKSWEESLPLTLANGESKVVKFMRIFPLKKLYNYIKKLPDFEIYRIEFSQISNGDVIDFYFSDDKKYDLRILEGNGSRNNKAGGGKKGKEFEYILASDLREFKNSVPVFTYPHIAEELYDLFKKEFKVDLKKDKYDVVVEGGKNQKRNMYFTGKEIAFKPDGNIGKIVVDVMVKTDKKEIPLSLKFSKTYYLINASLRPYLHLDKISEDVKERNEILKYFGFNPQKFCNGYGIYSSDNTEISESRIKKNWEQIITKSFGYGYVYVWTDGKNHNFIEYFKTFPKVKVNKVNEIKYAEMGKRKYSLISMDVLINGMPFIVDAQFRGTTGKDVFPYYMRVLLRKK